LRLNASLVFFSLFFIDLTSSARPHSSFASTSRRVRARMYGLSANTDAAWSFFAHGACFSTLSLYCFEQ